MSFNIKKIRGKPFGNRNYKQPTLAQKRAAYSKFLKNDIDFDWESILHLLTFKLARVREHIVGHDVHADVKETARDIAEVERRLRRVCDDKYHDELMKPHRKKYGTVKITDKLLPNGNYEMLFSYPKAKTAAQKRTASKEASRLYQLSMDVRDDDLRAALALMADKMMGWWC